MEYRISEYVGDNSVDKVYEGTPKEILELMSGMDLMFGKEEKEGLIYDQDHSVEFIYNQTGKEMKHYSKEGIREILNSDEDYMRSVGIIEN